MVSCRFRSLRLALYIWVPNHSYRYVIIHLQRFTKHIQGSDQQVVSNIALLLYRTVLHMSYISGYVRTSERGREKSSTPVEWAQTETSSSACLCSVIPSNIISSIHTGKPQLIIHMPGPILYKPRPRGVGSGIITRAVLLCILTISYLCSMINSAVQLNTFIFYHHLALLIPFKINAEALSINTAAVL